MGPSPLVSPGSPALVAVEVPLMAVQEWPWNSLCASFMKLLLKIISHLQANACTLLGIVLFPFSVCWALRRDLRANILLRFPKLIRSFHQTIHTSHPSAAGLPAPGLAVPSEPFYQRLFGFVCLPPCSPSSCTFGVCCAEQRSLIISQ